MRHFFPLTYVVLVNIHNNHATEGKEPLLPVLLVAASLEAFETALQMNKLSRGRCGSRSRSRSRSRRRLMTTLLLLSPLIEQR
jgi:hypothetical protein